MDTYTKNSGFSLVELLVTMALFSVISVAGFILFNQGQSISSLSIARIDLQNNARTIGQRLIAELQESGADENGVIQVTILDNTGTNGTDVLRFSVPICPCGVLPINQNGDVKYWGAPLSWGQSGCGNSYAGMVDICHVTGLPTDMQVNANEVMAHLTHNDYIGDCTSCDPNAYTNRTIEYMVDANNRLLRRVLNQGSAVVASSIMAQNIQIFQAAFDAGQDAVTVTIQLQKNTIHSRIVSFSGSWVAKLQNKD